MFNEYVHDPNDFQVIHEKLKKLFSLNTFPELVKELSTVVEHEVDKKSGLSGILIKGGFKTIKAIMPNMIEKSIQDLLPEFIKAFQPIYEEFEKSTLSNDLVAYMTLHQKKIADALLGVTDMKANVGKHKLLIEVYKKLRPLAQEQVASALPAVAKVFVKFAL
jgi:hypothetical protein